MELRRTIQALLEAERHPEVRQTKRTSRTLIRMMEYLCQNPGTRAFFLTHSEDWATQCCDRFAQLCKASDVAVEARRARLTVMVDKGGNLEYRSSARFVTTIPHGVTGKVFEDHHRFELRLEHLLNGFQVTEMRLKKETE